MKIAIITFHAAHNYGAVIQAYALQRFLIDQQFECDILDFRSESQVDFNALYPRRNGIKSVVKNALMLPYHSGRLKRVQRFDSFLQESLQLTGETASTAKELEIYAGKYDCFISGSDQVWNVRKKADVSTAYFLDFVKDNNKKIAYAVSLGNSTEADMTPYKPLIEAYKAVSTREKSAAEILERIIDTHVNTVLDPTLLVDPAEYDRILKPSGNSNQDDYIFYYSLDGYDKRKNNVEELQILSRRLGKRVLVCTPEWPKREAGFVNIIDAGPSEFLSLIKHAALVCTNSFHGTALSIAFHKNFYVLDVFDGVDTRKVGILEQLDLLDRMMHGRKMVEEAEIRDIDYEKVDKKLDGLRENSRGFLLEAINCRNTQG